MLTLIGIIDKPSNVLIEVRCFPSLSVWNREIVDIMSQDNVLSRHSQDFEYVVLTEQLDVNHPYLNELQKFQFPKQNKKSIK